MVFIRQNYGISLIIQNKSRAVLNRFFSVMSFLHKNDIMPALKLAARNLKAIML
jgi:hypothetical protein